jgi:hypothetical protein
MRDAGNIELDSCAEYLAKLRRVDCADKVFLPRKCPGFGGMEPIQPRSFLPEPISRATARQLKKDDRGFYYSGHCCGQGRTSCTWVMYCAVEGGDHDSILLVRCAPVADVHVGLMGRYIGFGRVVIEGEGEVR